ncbi:MAG: hypothetical protein ACR2M1_05220 [Gemmatimonadaceae bacterium]
MTTALTTKSTCTPSMREQILAACREARAQVRVTYGGTGDVYIGRATSPVSGIQISAEVFYNRGRSMPFAVQYFARDGNGRTVAGGHTLAPEFARVVERALGGRS